MANLKTEKPTEYAVKLAESAMEFADTHNPDVDICAVLICRNLNLPEAAILMIQEANDGKNVMMIGGTIHVVPKG